MRHRLAFLLSLALLFLLTFALGKLCFLACNHAEAPFAFPDVAQVLWHGLPMDLSTMGYLLALPWLFCLLTLLWWKLPLRKCLLPYFVIVCPLLALMLTADAVMYQFWHFKLDSTVLPYLANASEATNSVSLWFLISRLALTLALALALTWIAIKLTPRRLAYARHTLATALTLVLLGACLFLCIRGGLRQSTMNVGTAYYSPKLFLNHAAVNPAFSFLYSVSKNKDFAHQFQLLDESTRLQAFAPLYASTDEAPADTLLRTPRPNILIILMESFGGTFVEELGGLPGVAPNLSRLIRQSVFWDSFYANSFRTDRGTVCTFSGWISYPTLSLMRIPGRTATLPSIARTLAREGYSTTYLYGGDIKIMGKQGYLVATGYQRLISISDFPLAQANESKWGVNDSTTAQAVLHTVKELSTAGKPWHVAYQTLSSHEPWQVPYQRLEDPVLNAFAYTDRCLGQLIDSLSAMPCWDSTLVVLLPDHNTTYRLAPSDPDFYHCPMLWTGGAIRQPRTLSVLMNQSDLPATLLAQLGLPHDDFPWSRDVLSPAYATPFAYSSWPEGIVLRDEAGATAIDLNKLGATSTDTAGHALRTLRAKAILQTSYQGISDLH